jgi:hypothetical protein
MCAHQAAYAPLAPCVRPVADALATRPGCAAMARALRPPPGINRPAARVRVSRRRRLVDVCCNVSSSTAFNTTTHFIHDPGTDQDAKLANVKSFYQEHLSRGSYLLLHGLLSVDRCRAIGKSQDLCERFSALAAREPRPPALSHQLEVPALKEC